MKKIFVGNFAFSMTESELRSMFEPHGQVDSVTIVTDRDTGRSRGFAFVEMSENGERREGDRGAQWHGLGWTSAHRQRSAAEGGPRRVPRRRRGSRLLPRAARIAVVRFPAILQPGPHGTAKRQRKSTETRS